MMERNDLILTGIPPDILELLWFDHPTEPSAISFDLEVSKYVDYGSLWYWPSYRTLTPGQRYRYLKWLCDIRQPIDFGYLFLFYYGLERHLVEGKFDESFRMINILRRWHKSVSFQEYSQNAMILASKLRNKLEMIEKIEGLFPNEFLDLIFIYKNMSINVDKMIKYCRKFGWLNKRYINKNYNLFRELLGQSFQITQKDIEESPKIPIAGFANYSIQPQTYQINHIFYNPKIQSVVFEKLKKTHEKIKSDYRGKV